MFTADDFGFSSDVNSAVIRAYQNGVLTAASMMVTGQAAEEAAAMARQNPGMAVGLHVVLTHGRPALPPEAIPSLTNAAGRFFDDPIGLGLKLFFSPKAQRQLAIELEAQFKKFSSFNLPLSHVDGHLHFHLHPTVRKALIPLAVRFGARGFRVVGEDVAAVTKTGSDKLVGKTILNLVFRALAGRGAARKAGLITADRIYGFFRSGDMSEAYVLSVLKTLHAGTTELYFHPSTSEQPIPKGPNRGDLATLLSDRVRSLLCDRNLRATSYRDLG